MKVGLMGFGKTGKAVASVLLQSRETNLQWVVRKSHTLEHRSVPEFLGISSSEPGFIYSRDEFQAKELINKLPVDVIIDFSAEEGIEYYGNEARDREVSIISAISHYSPEKIDYLSYLAEKTRVVWSPNITVGINFLIIAAKILKKIAPYTDIEIVEEHFKSKPEISGTAKKIASSLDLPEESIKTIRAGGIIGVHEILFGFPFQTVRLKHESITREAFGNGVLFAARHIQDKDVGLYSMEDLMMPYFNIEQNLP
ncbi:MAG: dihydrodipicolinate reductase C-terminal domain-containing protein [Desulfuromonadaceae bacterium]|nr:dihydrodipicolinate reductase C-terminal domain-containing protein [Desulfuromonadaceae bacterium]MDD5104385.1 dihydrodipicolinate reductase C-terminal domain-containing protein [Desulfuromonadaceae bacterium]